MFQICTFVRSVKLKHNGQQTNLKEATELNETLTNKIVSIQIVRFFVWKKKKKKRQSVPF
jgi:hypothetical protein